MKYLYHVRFVYMIKNMIYIRSQNNIVKNIKNNKFVMYIFFEKRIINT